MANLSKLSLPLGYRFLPYDVELVSYYLKRKVAGRKFEHKGDIPDIALKNYSPSEIREMSYPKTKDLEGFFFCSLGSRYSNGQRKNRSSKFGYWKATGKDKAIYNKSHKVGWRRTLTFYRGKAKGNITDWRIHEYRLEDKELPIASNYQNEFVVLCKIFEKKNRGPKTDEEYESPVEEDADDSVNGDDGSLVSLLPAIPSSSLGPEEGQSTVATTSTLDFENRQDAVLPFLPTHTATPIAPQHHPSCPGLDIPKLLLNNVSDENGNTCNGSGSHQVDSVPTKSIVEDLDTHGIYKGSEDISDHREMDSIDNSNSIKQLEEENLWQDHWSPGLIDGFMELKDFFLNNVSDEDGNTCNGSGSHQVDSVPTKSTVEDLDTHGIYKGSDDISDHREMDSIDNSNSMKQLEEENFWQHHLSPGSIDGLEVKDLLNPMEEDCEAYIQWDDLSSPVPSDVSNQGMSFLPAPNATPVLPAHEAMDCSRNIRGHREPTCDSAAHSPLKAGEIVGQYTPRSLARASNIDPAYTSFPASGSW